VLTTTLENTGVGPLVSVTGDFDVRSAPTFRKALESYSLPAADDVVLDLSDVGFLDSSGLAAIIDLHLRLEAAGARLMVVPGGTQIDHMFSVTGIRRFVRVKPTRADAVESLGPARA
jgi:anti-sigma B factor antagonist